MHRLSLPLSSTMDRTLKQKYLQTGSKPMIVPRVSRSLEQVFGCSSTKNQQSCNRKYSASRPTDDNRGANIMLYIGIIVLIALFCVQLTAIVCMLRNLSSRGRKNRAKNKSAISKFPTSALKQANSIISGTASSIDATPKAMISNNNNKNSSTLNIENSALNYQDNGSSTSSSHSLAHVISPTKSFVGTVSSRSATASSKINSKK